MFCLATSVITNPFYCPTMLQDIYDIDVPVITKHAHISVGSSLSFYRPIGNLDSVCRPFLHNNHSYSHQLLFWPITAMLARCREVGFCSSLAQPRTHKDTHTHTHTHTHKYTHTQTHTHTHTHRQVQKKSCSHIYTHVPTYTHTHKNTHIHKAQNTKETKFYLAPTEKQSYIALHNICMHTQKQTAVQWEKSLCKTGELRGKKSDATNTLE